jgi:hypothetical protein
MFVTIVPFLDSTSLENSLFCRVFFVFRGKIVKCLTNRHTYDLFSSRIGVSMYLQV